MAPEFAVGANTVEHVAAVLRAAMPHLRVRDHGTLRLDPHGDVNPDVFVMTTDGPTGMEPFDGRDCLLVVEVAASTLAMDTGIKRDAYAGAGIPRYWVIDPAAGTMEVYGDPQDRSYSIARSCDVGPAGQALDPDMVAKLWEPDAAG